MGHGTVDRIAIENMGVYEDCTPTVSQEKEKTVARSPVSYDEDPFEQAPWQTAIWVYFQFTVLSLFGLLADWLRSRGLIATRAQQELEKQKDFARLDNHFAAMYVNNIYRMASEVVNRPLCGVPSTVVKLKDRTTNDYGWTYQLGGETEVLNLGSYNYLGFSQREGPCADAAVAAIDRYGITVSGTRHEMGTHVEQQRMEEQVARFLGVEEAIVFPMGFGTSSMNIPALVDEGSLIVSDELNHSSLILGSRLSKAHIVIFKHNDYRDCERVIRNALCQPSPKTGKPYNKMLLIIEGIYSMEGTIVNLPEFIRIKKKYRAYLFIDEAHSIGALGASGKGVVEYWGCDPRDVDVMMGTLTKSFAGAGGYLGGARATIRHIRTTCAGSCYGPGAMSPPIIAQIRTAMRIMQGEDGTDLGERKARQLERNTRYFRRSLKRMGYTVYGHDESPVIPVMTYYLTKVVSYGRETLNRKLAIVSVGYPATPLTMARVRFCISADHTKEQLDHALSIAAEVGDITGTKYSIPTQDLVEF